jgi:hypothetical protein
MMTRISGEEYRMNMVCVDSCENGAWQGQFYNPWLPKGRRFSSLSQFLLEMDRTLDEMAFPRAFTAGRSFAEVQAAPVPAEDEAPDGQIRMGKWATFAVRVLFRKNTSWQGSVTWIEGRQEQSFRSVLELIRLMESVLQQKKVF